MKDKIKIIVATHKKCKMPKDNLYLPVHVGAAGKQDLGYQRDDEGQNISFRNKNFCELTGLYWAYKNLTADYLGMVHYRRYFAKKSGSGKNNFGEILGEKEFEQLFEKCDVILPKKQHYYIETLYSHYAHTHNENDLKMTTEVIRKICPEYLKDWKRVMKRRSGHMYNMFVMKRPYVDQYCDWLFPILFELEKRIDISKYDAFQARVFGRISEFLIDVWIEHNKIRYIEVPVLFMGKIKWKRKVISFLKAKFKGEKYNASF